MTLTEPIMKSAQNIYRMSCGMNKEKTKPHNRKLLKNIQNLIRHFIFILEFLKMHLIILTLYLVLCLAILCVAIAAPTFAGEYQTGGDSILRTTKYGRKQLAITKILAAFTLFVVTFLVGITVHILILDAAFGTDCLKTSFQMRYSIINLPNINLGQLQIILVAAGLLSVLATVSCTLFLSAKCKDTLTVLLISIVVLLMPLFAYVAMGATWLSTILPSAGIGMQNNFLYQLADFNYLNIGGMIFWTPHVF